MLATMAVSARSLFRKRAAKPRASSDDGGSPDASSSALRSFASGLGGAATLASKAATSSRSAVAAAPCPAGVASGSAPGAADAPGEAAVASLDVLPAAGVPERGTSTRPSTVSSTMRKLASPFRGICDESPRSRVERGRLRENGQLYRLRAMSSGARYGPVTLRRLFAIASGVPSATMRPPASPPPGPRSTT